MSKVFYNVLLVLSLICIIGFASPTCLYAQSLDDLNNNSSVSNGSGGSSNDSAVSDYLRDYSPVTQDNMRSAQVYASPLVNLIGTFTGFVVMIVSAGIFAITALDLCYIGLPFMRQTLNPNYTAGGQGGGMGMGMRGGGGYGGGGFGGGGFGGGAAMGGAPQQTATKSVILEYLKKRTVFIVIFAVATVVLTSSALTGCGINLGELLLRIIDKFSGNIGTVNV